MCFPLAAWSFHMLSPVLSHSISVCCPGQIWYKITPFAELFSLPPLYPYFLCGCTNIWHNTNSVRNGSDKTGITASPHPQWQFWFRCTSDYHLREREQSRELQYLPKICYRHEKCIDCWKVREGEVKSGKNSWYFSFQGVRKFLFYLVLICEL